MVRLLVSGALAALGIVSAGHALVTKRDPRSALGWIVACLALPGLGAGLYWLMGVNRIRTRARGWKAEGKWDVPVPGVPCSSTPAAQVSASPPPHEGDILTRIGDRVTKTARLGGNRVRVLHNGEAAFPAMLYAIAHARESVYLSTYIFRTDQTGRRFIAALGEAAERGVDVRVLLDGMGVWYTWPHASRPFSRTRVRVAQFLPLRLGPHLNLRNHRKLLIVDGVHGFTGGLNIGDHQLAERADNPHRAIDVHLAIVGPVVEQMEHAFVQDWCFATGDPPPARRGRAYAPAGGAICRGISAGPNEDFEKLYWMVLGTLSAAQRRLRVMTPYFIPDRPLILALNMAALRGVRVEILLPERSNLPYVDWAARALLWEILGYGVRVYLQPSPFVHTKLLLVDDSYALVGSANLDPRSLRLNFEFDLEIDDAETAGRLIAHFDQALARSREITLGEMDARPLSERLRDAVAKLLSPYL